MEKGFGVTNTLHKGHAVGEVGGDGGGEEASGAMSVMGAEARRADSGDPGRSDEGVGGKILSSMPPLQKKLAYAKGVEPLDHRGHLIVSTRIGGIEEGVGLIEIGGDEGTEGEELLHHCMESRRLQQRGSTGAHQHRIQYDTGEGVSPQNIHDHFEDRFVGQHTDLDRIDTEILEESFELEVKHLGGYGFDTGHSARVLSRHGGHGGHSIPSEGMDRLGIHDDPRTPIRVKPRDAQNSRGVFRVHRGQRLR